MIRRFNYTGRKRLPKACATVHLYPSDNAFSEFEASLDLSGQGMPSQAKVYVEAFYKSSMMRFDYGTVEAVQHRADERHELTDILNTLAFFRLKVVDETEDIGRIVGVIERIKPTIEATNDAIDSSLIFVQYDDLEDTIWELDLDDTHPMPILKVNNQLEIGMSVQEFTSNYPGFQTLVYPAVIREVLTYITIISEPVDEGEDNWKHLWLQFGNHLIGQRGVPHLENPEDKLLWIADVVQAFSKKHTLRNKLEQEMGEK